MDSTEAKPQSGSTNSVLQDLLLHALREPQSARTYWLNEQLHQQFPERVILQTADFEGRDHADAHGYQFEVTSLAQPETTTVYSPRHEFKEYELQSIGEVEWQGKRMLLVTVSWDQEYCRKKVTWIIADDTDTAKSYLSNVVDWNNEVRGEILVFESGQWGKSKALYESIQSANFENLILPIGLKAELKHDLQEFLKSKVEFERYWVPWKRGLLFYGPPGNGKTHTVKALVNWLKSPCLYVKSFQGNRYESEHVLISHVFAHARTCAPCLLILEDLDSLINDRNRSFFLNELDGFAANTGIVIIATTNHPERLDPAIVDRPSRFDRKYEFALPAEAERRAYLSLWGENAEAELRLNDKDLDRIVALTEDFSFAYLKELWLSSMMRWMEAKVHGGMGGVMLQVIPYLREQMSTPISELAPLVDEYEEDD